MKIRNNVYSIDDDILIWYSRAVAEMKKRDISDPTSWWYQAAVHGYLNNNSFWQNATGYPPSQALQDSGYWKRCQHGTWYFLPWHRMYLYYFEQIVSKTIGTLGGPTDWILPYWNYCDYFNTDISQTEQQQALTIPPAFGSQAGPNSDSPELWITGRWNYKLNPYNVNPWYALQETEFTNSGDDMEFGGGKTGFSHFGNRTGQLENLPHNVIHNDVGGAMANPNTAALDPIFWLHHANIDRLWQVWLDVPGRTNPQDGAWREFVFKFHNADKQPVTLAVKDVETTVQLGYSYSANYPLPETPRPAGFVPRTDVAMDVVGASTRSTDLGNAPTSVKLEMVPAPMRNATLKAALQSGTDKRTILRINNVTGSGNAPPINVFVNSKSTAENDEAHFVGSIGLFGLDDASTPGVQSDGSGLNFSLDASKVINQLRKEADWEESNISIQLVPQSKIDDKVSINIGRVSLHTECKD